MVVTEGELDGVLDDRHFGVESPEGFPPDPLSIWANTLDKHNLGFIVDETTTSPRGRSAYRRRRTEASASTASDTTARSGGRGGVK